MSQNRVLVGLPDRLDKCKRALAAAEGELHFARDHLIAVSYERDELLSAVQKIAAGRGKYAKVARDALTQIKQESNQ